MLRTSLNNHGTFTNILLLSKFWAKNRVKVKKARIFYRQTTAHRLCLQFHTVQKFHNNNSFQLYLHRLRRSPEVGLEDIALARNRP